MKYQQTKALDKILALKKRLRIIQGGSSAGKTIAILLILIDIAQTTKGKTISVVSESFPHLRRGAIKDFLDIMEAHGYYKDDLWSKTDFTYRFETGSKIEFFSADSSDKVRGPRRDILFINEANNINYETYTQLAIRTNEDIYIDYNPVTTFWVQDEILNKLDNDFLILTYQDNQFLSENIVKEIESRKNRKGWWQVYGLGQLGEVEGKIFTDWQIIDELPHNAKLEVRGLDFGYTNDPTALVAIYYYNGGYIWDEEIYQKGLQNPAIATTINNLDSPHTLVVADSAEPKSIDEIKSYGINIIGVAKTKGESKSETFKKWSIGLVQGQRVSVTKRSVNIIREYRNYLWMVDKDGKTLNEPEHEFSHSMDAGVYAMVSLLNKPAPIKQFRYEVNRIPQNSTK